MKKGLLLIICLIFILIGFNACKKEAEVLTVNTVGVTSVNTNSVTAYGNITGMGIVSKGFCWDTIKDPTIEKNHSDEGNGSDAFKSSITDLLSNKRYYLRAYAKNDLGLSYGDNVTFQTLKAPQIETYSVSILSYSYVTAGGFVSPNGHSIIASGICFDTLKSPDISKTKVSASAGTYFNLKLDSLVEKKVYYYRAYATFTFGTYYGAEKSFTTAASPVPLVVFTNTGTVSDIDGNVYKTIKIGNQTWMAENLKVQSYNDGSLITKINANASAWGNTTSGALGYYNNNSANYYNYGALYNFYAIEDMRGLAPIGWHIPTAAEWQTMMTVLVNANITYSYSATQQLYVQSGWSYLYCNTNNYSNMRLLSGGYRSTLGADLDLGYTTGFWTIDNTGSYGTILFFDNTCYSVASNKLKNSGYSIRCVKD